MYLLAGSADVCQGSYGGSAITALLALFGLPLSEESKKRGSLSTLTSLVLCARREEAVMPKPARPPGASSIGFGSVMCTRPTGRAPETAATAPRGKPSQTRSPEGRSRGGWEKADRRKRGCRRRSAS